MILVIAALLIALAPGVSSSATYYVSTTGNNGNAGTESAPWRTIAFAVDQMVAGDTTFVRGGTYSESGVRFRRSGTAGSPIRLANHPNEFPRLSCTGNTLEANSILIRHNSGSLTPIGWLAIEGIEITGCNDGIKGNNVHDSIFRRNWIHHNRNQGVLINGSRDVVFHGNVLNHNGAFETCTSCDKQHGLYASGPRWTVTRNVFYDNLGFGIQQNGASSSMDAATHAVGFRGAADWVASGNTFAYQRNLAGVVIWGPNTTNTRYENNIFYENNVNNVGSSPNGIQFTISSTSSLGILIRNNISYATGSGATAFLAGGTAGVTYTASGNSVNSINPSFINGGSNSLPATPNWALASASGAINFGRANEFSANGLPDAGAHETFTPVAAVASGTSVDVTFQGAFAPLLLTGTSGWSVGCNDCGTLTVANLSLLSPSSARLTVSGWTGGQCAAGKTITATFNASTGSVTDSARIGNLHNQPLHSFTNYPVANQCETGSPPPTLTPELILYELDGNAQDSSGDGFHGTQEGGTFAGGKYGQALQGTSGTAVRVTSPYGEAVDLAAQDLTIAFGYDVPVGAENATQTIAGSALGVDQRFFASLIGGTAQIGVGTSTVSAATPSNIAVQSGWNRFCIRNDSAAKTVQLYVNGIAGPMKSYAALTLASDLAFGLPPGFSASVAGGGKWDRASIRTVLESCQDDWLAWEPPPPPSEGIARIDGHQWQRPFKTIAGGIDDYGAPNACVDVVQRGILSLVTQVSRTGAPGPAINPRLWYSHDDGEAQPLSNILTSDQVAYIGSTAPDLYTGPVECCLTGSLDPNGGATHVSADTLPTYGECQDCSFVRRSVIRFGDTLGVYRFLERDQFGAPLNGTVTPAGGACARVIPAQASGGF